MENIEKRILQFGELSPEEREAVEAYVGAHPEWRPLFEDVRALEALREEMRLLHEAGDEALAYYAVARHFGIGVSAPLQCVFERLEARLASDEALRERYDALTGRLIEIAAALDPVAQFERLSGFRLTEGDSRASKRRPGRAPTRGALSSDGQRVNGHWGGRAVRRTLAAAFCLAVAYGVLFGISYLTQSDVDRLALVDLSEIEIEGYRTTTRGAEQPVSKDSLSTDALYLRALYTLRDAQTSTLGLFPRYDREKLTQAEELLRRVVEREKSRSFLQLEAYFFLGKVHLAQGKIEAARSSFRTVAICEGRRSPEAVQILTVLQEEYPADDQSYRMVG